MSAVLPTHTDRWSILNRVHEFDIELRVNAVRLLAVAVLYVVELANFHGLDLGFLNWPPITSRAVHLSVTLLVTGWCGLVFLVHICRWIRYFPEWLKFLTTGLDVLLLTGAITLTRGPSSTLLPVYFLILVLASLRFNLPLLWFALGAVLVSYLFVLGHALYPPEGWYAGEVRMPRHQQILFALILTLVGIALGQAIRLVRRLAFALAQQEQQP